MNSPAGVSRCRYLRWAGRWRPRRSRRARRPCKRSASAPLYRRRCRKACSARPCAAFWCGYSRGRTRRPHCGRLPRADQPSSRSSMRFKPWLRPETEPMLLARCRWNCRCRRIRIRSTFTLTIVRVSAAPDIRVARVGRQPPVARVRLIDGIAHAHADFIALLRRAWSCSKRYIPPPSPFCQRKTVWRARQRSRRKTGTRRYPLTRRRCPSRRRGLLLSRRPSAARARMPMVNWPLTLPVASPNLVDQLAADGISAHAERRTAVIRREKAQT